MNQKQINALLNLAQKLHKQKLPVVAIVVIMALAFFTEQYALLDSFFGTSQHSPTVSTTSTHHSKQACEVIKVYDGDTVTLQCPEQVDKVRIRLYCIDAPEIKQTPWGELSRDHLRNMIPLGTSVTYEQIDRDQYGRIVGEIYTLDGNNINQIQVKQGMAAVYMTYCNKPAYASFQARAQRDKAGIWSESGAQQTPWDWRKANK